MSADPGTGITHTAANYLANSYDLNGNPNGVEGEVGTDNELTDDGTYTYSYDTSGDLTRLTLDADGSYTTFGYDVRHRLASVETYVMSGETAVQTGETDYAYDMFNNVIARTIKTFTDGSDTGSASDHFVYDGTNIVLAFDGSENLTDRYLFGPGINQIIASEHFALGRQQPNPLQRRHALWPLPDNQGTFRDLVDSSARTTTLGPHRLQPLWQAPPHTASDPAVVDFLFEHAGSFYDRTTSLEHDGQRWYDSLIERWLTQDPSGLRPDSNPYRPLGNDPTNFTDSTGLIKRGKDGQIIATDNGGGVSVHSQPNGSVAVRMRSWSIFADDGTPIQAWENLSSRTNWDSDCHGLSFADGKYWINNSEVGKILKGDKYVEEDHPKPGDVVVYRNKHGDIVHSAVVKSVNASTKQVIVISKGGTTDVKTVDVVPGPNGAWLDSTATYKFYRKP